MKELVKRGAHILPPKIDLFSVVEFDSVRNPVA